MACDPIVFRMRKRVVETDGVGSELLLKEQLCVGGEIRLFSRL